MNNDQASPPSPTHKKNKLALWLLLAPTIIIAVSVILYGLVNWIAGVVTPEAFTPTDDVAENLTQNIPTWATVLNTILYTTGIIGAIAWLPGLIVGGILFAAKKRRQP